MNWRDRLPPARGRLLFDEALAPFTWLRVGGPADVIFLPEDEADLAGFLRGLDPSVPVTAIGVGSNLLVRDGGVEGGLAFGDAFGLEFLELAEGLFELPLETLLIDREIDEGLGVLAEDVRGGEGGVDLGVIGRDVGGGFHVAECEHAVFDGADAVEAPLGVDEGLGVLALDRRFGGETLEEFFGEGLVGFEVFFGEDDDASGESVAAGVDRGSAFAFFGAGTGRFLRIFAVRGDLRFGCGGQCVLLVKGIPQCRGGNGRRQWQEVDSVTEITR